MALKQPAAHKPARSPRLPGEDAAHWTVRTAYLGQKPNGRWIVFYTDINPGGDYRTCQQACFTTDANEAAVRFAEWKQARLTPAAVVVKGMTFADLTRHYLNEVERDRFTRNQHSLLRPALVFFAHDLASMITRERLLDYHDGMSREGLKTGTIRVRLTVVLTVLRHGMRLKLIPPGSCPDYRLPAFGPPRQYVLTPEQDRIVFQAAVDQFQHGDPLDARIGLFVCIAAETAQRRAAILALTWDRVDMTPGQESLDFRRPGREPKNKRAAVVPISARLLPVIQHARARFQGSHPTGPVFDSQNYLLGFDRFREKLNLPDLTPHVFRHTWATFALKRGMPVALVARIMADNVATIIKNYLHLGLDDTRAAMNKYMAA